MTTTVKQQQQLKELHKNIWNICCDFWGKMTADDYKDYVLGLLFYRYLSEKVETLATNLLKEDNISYEDAWKDEEYQEAIREEILATLGFVIEPQYLFNSMYNLINVDKKGFDIEYLSNAVNALMDSTRGKESQEAFDGIFEDMDLSSTKLGKSVSDRSNLIAKAITNIGSIDFEHGDSVIDVMGDAYEYLIGQFAADGGKKSGSFYTPAQVDKLLAKIVTSDKKEILNAYDGCGGSGALLLAVGKEANVRNYYYQELTTTTYNLARMNMLIHGINYQNFHMENNDTLLYPEYLDVPMDVVVANPPYSQTWSADKQFLLDERFSSYGVLAPKSKADFAFLLSMFHTLKEDGTMAVVLPHGVLFRGGTEAKIRETLIKNNNIDAIIGLAPNLFFGTSIPACVIILKKNKKTNDILFIDASKEFQSGKNQNYIRDEDVEKIANTYIERKEIEKYSHLATLGELEENEFNLNIPRYVDSFEEEEEINIQQEMTELEKEKIRTSNIDKELEVFFKELGLTLDPKEIEETMEVL